jgi:GAF domain-containing protein/anti-sigma regulatory factor (Ser/Thr protein kinase)
LIRQNNTILGERQASLLQVVYSISELATSILDLDHLLQHTVDVICDELGFYYVGVFLVDEIGEWAVLRAGRGEAGAAMIAQGHKLKVNGPAMVGAATGRRQATFVPDVPEERVHSENCQLRRTRSKITLPLAVGNRLIGVLVVQNVNEAAFGVEDVTALQAMADQLAIAVNHVQLHEQDQRLLVSADRRSQLLEAAAVVGRDVTSILDLDDLLGRTVDIICDVYGFYYAGVFLMDETGDWAVLRAGRGEAGAAMLAEGHALRVGGRSMIGAATVQRKARITLDVGEEPVHFRNPHLPHTRSEMALPLVVGEEILGALTVQSEEEAAFSDDDITSLQAMADQLAVAINNAQLLEALEAAHAELVRVKTFEAVASSTLEAIHWIGNKTLPIVKSVDRLWDDLDQVQQSAPDLAASMREDLAMVRDSAELIESVKEHLIGPAREERPRPAMLDDVVKDVGVRLGIPAKVISYRVAPDLPLTLTDTTQLSRAVGYILKNAMEAIEGAAEQRITVALAPTEGRRYVAVRIADSGPGIPEEKMDDIWVAFYTTKGAKHAGLGLSACMQIIQQLGGKVTAANVAGGGALFELAIPVFEGPLVPGDWPAGRSILLIDDADAWGSFAITTLASTECSLARSTDGQIDPTGFDVILVDDTLETADNREVLKRLRKAGASDRVFVITSNLQVERTIELMRFGVKDVVLKPYTPAALAEILNILVLE